MRGASNKKGLYSVTEPVVKERQLHKSTEEISSHCDDKPLPRKRINDIKHSTAKECNFLQTLDTLFDVALDDKVQVQEPTS